MKTQPLATDSAAWVPPRERVLIALANPQNVELLGGLLGRFYDVVAGVDDATDFGAIDLCILDGPSLFRHRDLVARARARSEPLVLPVLMLSERRDVGMLSGELWRVVDDVLLRPLEKGELVARARAMLRMRRLSRQLERVSGLYRQERRIAERLQDAALPRTFPEVAGLRFSAFYRPGASDARVGGDWYDVVRLIDGRVVISVGDVAGSGLEAAVSMANVRQVVRGVAHLHAEPAMILEAADRTLQSEDSGRIVTAFVGVLDPVTRLLVYSSAGHPPPLLKARGELCELSARGLALGIARGERRGSAVVTIPDDATLLLYTDGLTESTHDIDAGERRVQAALADPAVLASADLAAAVHDFVVRGESRDDVAVFSVQTAAVGVPDGLYRWSFVVEDGEAARRARVAFSAALEGLGFGADATIAAETVYAELIGNVVRYAGGRVDVILDPARRAPVLHVLDRGPGFRFVPRLPLDLLAERGRGLYIINELTEEFHVALRPDGGSHARAVLGDGREVGTVRLAEDGAGDVPATGRGADR